MADRVLRGSRLGNVSYESDRGADLAPRQLVGYHCPSGHVTRLVFATEAEMPANWECHECGAVALRENAEQPEGKKVKPPRTHWDMLMERRTEADLEELLEERLELVRELRTG